VIKDKGSFRKIIFLASVALVIWGIFNLYPQLTQTTERTNVRDLPEDKLWTYGFGVGEGTQAVYNVYHVGLGHNVTVSFTVVDVNSKDGNWKISVEVTSGKVKEKAYAITKKSILPVSGSQILGELESFAIATRMPVAEFIVGLKDQPLVVGANWGMAFLSPDNTYTWSSIVKKQDLDGHEVYVLSYGSEKASSLAWIAKNYPIPLRDEYKDPLSGEIISIYELVEYRRANEAGYK